MNAILWFLVIVGLCALVVIGALLLIPKPSADGAVKATARKSASLLSFIFATLAITEIWLLGWIFLPKIYGNPENVGVAGDMFGVLTSLFSGFAFAGLISTLLMQRQELEYQRQELRDTREEFSRQRFESSLFSIVGLWTQHIDGLVLKNDSDITLHGRAVLDYYASELPNQVQIILDSDEEGPFWELVPIPIFDDYVDQVLEYEEYYERELETDLGPYFRLLYHAIRHIERSNLDESDKQKYSKIVRAHLSSPELDLLFFNCFSKWGYGFRDWICDYRLLKHIRPKTKQTNPLLVEDLGPDAFSD
ncbi:hypothetical protein EU803_00260 [Loktanella sp. IMCC34160]|uniref:putative phage abortive infection protein n=1 Tax=Loktanella sp. IMCC34160 TaxID=2510646 RepID=UPI00101C1407|nr:putative phage abortive infection protein [Loktanella sp. IMCC34160]RYG92576.1 hypothetical protein EU803_00260 [Loktanella sp. IMCC34160]